MMKRYVKKVIAILMIMMMLSPNFINVVNAETTTAERNGSKVQISLLDGCEPNSTLIWDVNCDGIISIRDAGLWADYVNGESVNITEKGLENVRIMTNNDDNVWHALAMIGVAIGEGRVLGMNEFEVGDSLTLKAYSEVTDGFSQIGSETLSNVTWKSSDVDVAEVDSNGNVSFKTDGEVFIKATTEDGLYYDEIKFYVGNVEEIVKLTGDYIIKGSKETKVNLKIDVSSCEKTMAGFKIKLAQQNSNEENEQLVGEASGITIKTEGWEITEKNTETDASASTYNSYYTFVVEPDDEYLEEENLENIPQTLEIEFTFPVDVNSNIGGNVFWTDEFEGTDVNGDVSDLLNGLSVGLCKRLADPILTVKEGIDTNAVSIVGNDIYVKTNDKNLTEFYSKLENNLENFDYYYMRDYEQNIISNTEGISTGHLYIVGKDASEYKYNLYAIGDICLDSAYAIDINDVVYLRKAIVGLYATEMPSNFCLETTDVNGSNVEDEGTRGLGDIGDVIEIRKRIVNDKWM